MNLLFLMQMHVHKADAASAPLFGALESLSAADAAAAITGAYTRTHALARISHISMVMWTKNHSNARA